MLKKRKDFGMLLHRAYRTTIKSGLLGMASELAVMVVNILTSHHITLATYQPNQKTEMKACIDDFIDNHDKYIKLSKLHDAACAEYYASKKPGDYTGD
jgi:hypothetical protein